MRKIEEQMNMAIRSRKTGQVQTLQFNASKRMELQLKLTFYFTVTALRGLILHLMTSTSLVQVGKQ